MGFSWNRCHTTLTTACRPRSPQPHSAPQDAESLLLPTGKGPLNWGGAMGISPTSNPRLARPDRVQRPGPLLQVTTKVRITREELPFWTLVVVLLGLGRQFHLGGCCVLPECSSALAGAAAILVRCVSTRAPGGARPSAARGQVPRGCPHRAPARRR